MHHVFVDFENVPNVDLALIQDRPADVTLLIGEKQRRLDLDLVRQIHAHAAQVSLVEVGASGRNALDLVLAWHLGNAVERHAGDSFFVISKDKDFDPLIKHLRARGLDVSRVDSFDGLPFLGSAAAPAPVNDPRFAKLIDRLQQKTNDRPVRRKTLLTYINGFFANQLTAPELEAVASALETQEVISFGAAGRVLYPEK